MKGWQVGLCVVLLSGITVGRPRKLGASNRFPLFLGQQQRQGHSLLGHHGDHHQHHEHHEEPLPESRALSGLYSAPPVEAEPLDSLYSAPAEEVVPLDGLYGAPAEEVVPLDGLYGAPPPEVLPSYAEELPPAPSEPEPVKAAPAAPMMMMDPSYNFEFTNDDSQRSETNDINGQLTGSYSYKTPGGENIVVKYRAGADTGFVIDNMDELNAALERSAAEPSARADTLDSYGAPSEAVAQTYSGETAEIELLAPGVDENMNLENNYRYGYKTSDHQVSQEADSEGEVTGSYSYTMEDGKVVEVRYTAGKDGFRVENMEDLMATVHDDNQEDLGQYGNAAEAVVVAKSAAIPNEDYNDYEPYVHEEIAAEPYVHQDMPYVHVDIPAEPYVHDEPVIAAKVAPPPVSAANTNKKSIGRRRVAVNKNNDHARDNVERSFSFEAKSDEHEFTEKADEAGERIGSYSYLTPEGDKITVRYSAGRNGFVILNPEEVLPQPVL